MSKKVLPSDTRGILLYAQSTRCVALIALWALSGCQPLNDLDVAASQFGRAGHGNTSAEAGTAGNTTTPLNEGGDAGVAPVAAGAPASASGGSAGSGHDQESGGSSSQGGASDAQGGDTAGGNGGAAFAGTGGDAGAPNLPLPDLPNDLPNSPVAGTISWATGTYTAGSAVLRTYEIATPTANYSVARSTGNIVSLNDRTTGSTLQWVGYTDLRPKRGVGVTTSPQPAMTTTVDLDSVTAKHVRVVSQSAAGDFAWVWDFYVTQATLTVTQAAAPFGFTYRGVPGGALDGGDRLGISSGAVQPATDSFSADLPGPAEWAYVADTVLGHSLFVIQHRDDSLGERYDSKDADSAAWTFGDGMLTETPARFSVGMLGTAAPSAIQARVGFVVGALH